jgi:hypothetical protein
MISLFCFSGKLGVIRPKPRYHWYLEVLPYWVMSCLDLSGQCDQCTKNRETLLQALKALLVPVLAPNPSILFSLTIVLKGFRHLPSLFTCPLFHNIGQIGKIVRKYPEGLTGTASHFIAYLNSAANIIYRS